MNKLTERKLIQIVKEELARYEKEHLFDLEEATEVFLFEGKGSTAPSETVSLDSLLERYDRGQISEARLMSLWERSIFWESNLLQEGIVEDIIDKAREWALKAILGGLKIMAKGAKLLSKGIAFFRKLISKIEPWCDKNPVICGLLKVIIPAAICLGILLAGGDASAADSGGIPDLSDAYSKDIEAAAEICQQMLSDKGDKYQAPLQEALKTFFSALEGGESSTEEMSRLGQRVTNICYENALEMGKEARNAAEAVEKGAQPPLGVSGKDYQQWFAKNAQNERVVNDFIDVAKRGASILKNFGEQMAAAAAKAKSGS